VHLYRDEGVVLRTQKLGEADRIVTFLTRHTGRVRAVGKGVRRTKSKFGSRLEPFMHVDVQFAHGRTLDIVTQAETLEPFGEAIAGDYARYTAGTAMLETADRLVVEEREPAVQQYLLLVGALRVLAAGQRDASLILDSFLLRSLAVAGYAPTFDECARCGAPGPHRSFSASAGGILCGQCRVPGAARPADDTVVLLGALLAGDWPTAEAVDVRYRKAASGIVAAYLQWHLERALRSLEHVER
jgi:DNA repair protein RecO (recombination protein O)